MLAVFAGVTFFAYTFFKIGFGFGLGSVLDMQTFLPVLLIFLWFFAYILSHTAFYCLQDLGKVPWNSCTVNVIIIVLYFFFFICP